MSNQNTIYTETSKKKALLLLFVIMIVGIIVIPGCSNNIRTGKNFTNPTASQLSNSVVEVDRSTKTIEKSLKKINSSAVGIDIKSSKILNKIDDVDIRGEVSHIQIMASDIRSETETIQEQISDIQNETQSAIIAAKSIESMHKKLKGFEEDGAAEARQNLYKMIAAMAALGGMIIIGGIALAFFNARMGAMIAGFGLIITLVAVAGTYYLQWIAITGFVLLGLGLLGTLTFFVRSFWHARGLQEAHNVNVELIEEMKDDIPEDVRKKLFENGGIADTKQSRLAKKTVKKTRKNISKHKNR